MDLKKIVCGSVDWIVAQCKVSCCASFLPCIENVLFYKDGELCLMSDVCY
jgi:hypothetical protein